MSAGWRKKLGLWIATSAFVITTSNSFYESSQGLATNSIRSGHLGQHIIGVSVGGLSG